MAVMGLVQMYYADRNPDNLNEAIKILASEVQEPQLQEAIITVPVEPEKLAVMVRESEGFIKLKMADLEADHPVEAGKLVRVKAKDDLVDVMAVAHLDSNPETGFIILVPNGAIE
jgi:hypothetical protein